jgi:hypothetical protein
MVLPLQWLRAALERPQLCPILTILIMKKLVIFSFFILSSIAMTSCTVDNVPTQAEDTGGQGGGITPPPPPKP